MLHKDEWLSCYFRGGAFSYVNLHDESFRTISEGFVYAKVPIDDQAEVNYLIQKGFKLVEVSGFFEQRVAVKHHIKVENSVGFVKKEEEQAILEIAESAFLTSRFYQDTHIPQAIANKIKRDWISSYHFRRSS